MPTTDRKSEILEVAKAMFAEHGVSQTTVRQIGAEAGILSGSLYHHFESKLDMVDEILRSFCDEVLEEYHSIATSEPTDDGLGRLRAMIVYAVSLVDRHRAALVIIQRDSDELIVDERFAYLIAFNNEVEAHWLASIRAGLAEGTIRSHVDPPMFYRLVRDAMLGTIRWYEPSHGKSAAAVAEQLTDIVLHGIAAP